MNYSKVRLTLAGIIGIAGFFTIMGATGRSDYMTAIGEYYPLWKTAVQMIIGLAMMAFSAYTLKDWDDEDDEWEDWEDEIYED